MVLSTDPFCAAHVALFMAALAVAYLVGGSLRFRTDDPFLNIGVRLCLGIIAVVAWVATIVTLGNTILLPISVFLLLSLDLKRLGLLFEDLRSVGAYGLVGIVLFALAVFIMEALRSDLRSSDGLSTGFPDIAFYSTFGNGIFGSLSEGIPNNMGTGRQAEPVLYHMGDLWLSGIFSSVLHVMPQYAYTTLSRGISLVAFGVLMFGMARSASGSYLWAMVVMLLSLLGVDTVLYYLFNEHLSILQTFVYNWPLYASGPYLNVAIAVLPFVVIGLRGPSIWPLAGLLLTSCLNPGIMLSFPAGLVALALLRAGLRLFSVSMAGRIPFSRGQLALLICISAVPFAFASLSGRSQGGAPPLTDFGYLYLILHTAIRALLSTIYFIPVLIGLIHLMADRVNARPAWVIAAGYAGTIAAFSTLFPWIQGNTVQIPALYSAALLVPVGLIGAASLIKKGGWKRWASVMAMAAMAFTSLRMLIATDGYAGTYRDLNATGTFQGLTHDEHAAFAARTHTSFLKIGYWVDPESAYPVTRPHYTEFTGIKGLMNHVEFYRLNELPSDTASALEMRQYFIRSALYTHYANHPGDPDAALAEFVAELRPQVLLTMVGSDVYAVPPTLETIYSTTDTVGRFIFHHRK